MSSSGRLDQGVAEGIFVTQDTAHASYPDCIVLRGAGIDPTGVADSYAAIQAKLDTLPAAGGFIYLPQGDFRVNAQLLITGKNRWKFTGPGRIRFGCTTASASGAIAALQVTNCISFDIEQITLDSITQNQQYNGLNITNCSLFSVEKVVATNFRWVGIGTFDAVAGTTTDGLIHNCTAEYNRFGISTNGRRIRILTNLVADYWLSSSEAGAPWANTSIYWDGIIVGAGASEITISGNTVVECGQSGIYTSSLTSGTISGNTVLRCQNWGIDTGPPAVAATALTVTGNTVVDCASGNYNLARVTDSTFTGNTSTNTGTLYFGAIINKSGIALQHSSLRNVVAGNTVTLPAAATAAAIFCEATAPAATGNTIGPNLITATVRYSVDSTANTLIDGSALGALGAGMKVGNYYTTGAGQSTTVFPEADMRCAPIVIGRPGTIDAIAISITGAGTAGAVVRLGLYADDGTGELPGALLSECTATVDGTAIGAVAKTLTTPQKVQAGQKVWVAAVVQGGAVTRPTVRFNQNVSNPAIGDSSISAVLDNTLTGAQSSAAVAGALPANFAGFHTGNSFRLAIRAA